MTSALRSWRERLFETSRAQWDQERAKGETSYIQRNAISRALTGTLVLLVIGAAARSPGADLSAWGVVTVRALVAGVVLYAVFAFLYSLEYSRLVRKYGTESERPEGERSTP